MRAQPFRGLSNGSKDFIYTLMNSFFLLAIHFIVRHSSTIII